jgi:hypothetical protein
VTRAATVALAVVATIAWMWNPGHSPRFDVSATRAADAAANAARAEAATR